MSADELSGCCITFVAHDEEELIVYEGEGSSKRGRPTELKLGRRAQVTTANLEEYLQLYATHKLVGAYRQQVDAFRDGLSVFIDEELATTLRACCTVAEIQLLLCGVSEINVDEWQQSTQYKPDSFKDSPQVRWLWATIRGMSPEERSKLLVFCTGSARVPATGFGGLMGYRGQQQNFTVLHATHVTDLTRLPPHPHASTS